MTTSMHLCMLIFYIISTFVCVCGMCAYLSVDYILYGEVVAQWLEHVTDDWKVQGVRIPLVLLCETLTICRTYIVLTCACSFSLE